MAPITALPACDHVVGLKRCLLGLRLLVTPFENHRSLWPSASWAARLCPFLSRRGAHIGLQLASTRHPGGLAGSYDDQYTGRCVFIGVLEVTARADGKCAVIACLLL